MTSLLSSIPSPTKTREELEQMVLKDLIGPVGGPEEEIDEQSVRDRYYPGSKEGHIPTRSASEGSGAFPLLARRVNMQQHAELPCRGNTLPGCLPPSGRKADCTRAVPRSKFRASSASGTTSGASPSSLSTASRNQELRDWLGLSARTDRGVAGKKAIFHSRPQQKDLARAIQ